MARGRGFICFVNVSLNADFYDTQFVLVKEKWGRSPIYLFLRRVDRVEELRAELHGLPLLDSRQFGESDVPVVLTRTEQDADTRVTELGCVANREWYQRRVAKRALVYPSGPRSEEH